MVQGEHSAIFSTFINKLPFVIKTYVLSKFEWPFYSGCTGRCIWLDCITGKFGAVNVFLE